jgi:hypothetical protein
MIIVEAILLKAKGKKFQLSPSSGYFRVADVAKHHGANQPGQQGHNDDDYQQFDEREGRLSLV